ncbi:MAG: hypothetical protein ACXAAO_00335 [Candidatus Thorarchaeota archaeon]|jgi:hypothetical protein
MERRRKKGVREKKREKPKSKEKSKVSEEAEPESEVVLEETELEEISHTPEVVVETKESAVTTKTDQAAVQTTEEIVEAPPKLDSVMPSWGDVEETEWMYSVPAREEDMYLWANEWSDYLLAWSENKRVHVMSLATFITEPPFKDLRDKIDSFRKIASVLVEKEVAEWRDRKKRQLRIYWRPLEDWADQIYQWAIKTGKLRLDVKSIVIQESAEDFSSLPEKDIHIVLALMVKKGLAEWVDQKKGAVIILTD